ncbi:MAG: zinc ribbon domain-containing protein [Candidatus Korarchaeota archaeon]
MELHSEVKEKAGERGIEMKEESKRGTSSACPNARDVASKGRLFKCQRCGLEALWDVIGVLNIARLHGGVVAHPSKAGWDEVGE